MTGNVHENGEVGSSSPSESLALTIICRNALAALTRGLHFFVIKLYPAYYHLTGRYELFFRPSDDNIQYMPQAIVWIFLLLSSMFATVHNLAVATSLYWYYSWFDIIMHFWGGTLVVLGVYALCSFKHVPLKPTSLIIFGTLIIVMITWELFEWKVGLFNPHTHLFDTSKDFIFGLTGGLVGYFVAIRLRM